MERISSLNKMVLLLNAAVLLVNCFVAFASSETQTRLLETGARLSAVRYQPAQGGTAGTFLRTVNAIQGTIPAQARDDMTAAQFGAIHDAVLAYYSTAQSGISEIVGSPYVGVVLRVEALNRQAKANVEQELGREFRDAALVQRIVERDSEQCALGRRMFRGGRDDAQEVHTVAHAEPIIKSPDVGLQRSVADAQLGGSVGTGHAGQKQCHDLALPVRQSQDRCCAGGNALKHRPAHAVSTTVLVPCCRQRFPSPFSSSSSHPGTILAPGHEEDNRAPCQKRTREWVGAGTPFR